MVETCLKLTSFILVVRLVVHFMYNVMTILGENKAERNMFRTPFNETHLQGLLRSLRNSIRRNGRL